MHCCDIDSPAHSRCSHCTSPWAYSLLQPPARQCAMQVTNHHLPVSAIFRKCAMAIAPCSCIGSSLCSKEPEQGWLCVCTWEGLTFTYADRPDLSRSMTASASGLPGSTFSARLFRSATLHRTQLSSGLPAYGQLPVEITQTISVVQTQALAASTMHLLTLLLLITSFPEREASKCQDPLHSLRLNTLLMCLTVRTSHAPDAGCKSVLSLVSRALCVTEVQWQTWLETPLDLTLPTGIRHQACSRVCPLRGQVPLYPPLL